MKKKFREINKKNEEILEKISELVEKDILYKNKKIGELRKHIERLESMVLVRFALWLEKSYNNLVVNKFIPWIKRKWKAVTRR